MTLLSSHSERRLSRTVSRVLFLLLLSAVLTAGCRGGGVDHHYAVVAPQVMGWHCTCNRYCTCTPYDCRCSMGACACPDAGIELRTCGEARGGCPCGETCLCIQDSCACTIGDCRCPHDTPAKATRPPGAEHDFEPYNRNHEGWR